MAKCRIGTAKFFTLLLLLYRTQAKAAEFPPLDRRLRKSEIRAAIAYLENLPLDGFSQGLEAARAEYIPAFDLTGVVRAAQSQ